MSVPDPGMKVHSPQGGSGYVTVSRPQQHIGSSCGSGQLLSEMFLSMYMNA